MRFLLVLAEDLQGLVDLGGEGLRRLEEVQKLSVVHFQEHAWGQAKGIVGGTKSEGACEQIKKETNRSSKGIWYL